MYLSYQNTVNPKNCTENTWQQDLRSDLPKLLTHGFSATLSDLCNKYMPLWVRSGAGSFSLLQRCTLRTHLDSKEIHFHPCISSFSGEARNAALCMHFPFLSFTNWKVRHLRMGYAKLPVQNSYLAFLVKFN